MVTEFVLTQSEIETALSEWVSSKSLPGKGESFKIEVTLSSSVQSDMMDRPIGTTFSARVKATPVGRQR